jgi:hypothetical protein
VSSLHGEYDATLLSTSLSDYNKVLLEYDKTDPKITNYLDRCSDDLEYFRDSTYLDPLFSGVRAYMDGVTRTERGYSFQNWPFSNANDIQIFGKTAYDARVLYLEDLMSGDAGPEGNFNQFSCRDVFNVLGVLNKQESLGYYDAKLLKLICDLYTKKQEPIWETSECEFYRQQIFERSMLGIVSRADSGRPGLLATELIARVSVLNNLLLTEVTGRKLSGLSKARYATLLGVYKQNKIKDSFDEDVSQLLSSVASLDLSRDLIVQYIGTLGKFTSVDELYSLSDAELLSVHQSFCLIYDRLVEYLSEVTAGLLDPRSQYVKVMDTFLMQ